MLRRSAALMPDALRERPQRAAAKRMRHALK